MFISCAHLCLSVFIRGYYQFLGIRLNPKTEVGMSF